MSYKITKILNYNKDVKAGLAFEGDKKVFVKIAQTKEGEKMNEREFHNQSFLYELSQKKNLGFSFLAVKNENGVLVYDFLDSDYLPLGRQEFLENKLTKSFVEPMEKYVGEFIEFKKAIVDIRFSDLPQFLQRDWEERKEIRRKNIVEDSLFCLEENLIGKKIFDLTLDLYETHSDNYRYNHHDIVPWHMFRKNEKTVLLDSGWAGWSFKYYDSVYLPLQLVAYADAKEEALKNLEVATEIFQTEDDFKNIFLSNFLYRGVKLIKELDVEHRSRPKAKNLNLFVEEIVNDFGF